MKIYPFNLSIGLLALGLSGAGCEGPSVTNTRQPGPAFGRAIGSGVGAVGGNVAGFGVGLGEGVAAGTASAFDNTTRTVRVWRTETTADGRTIQVPVDVPVDQYGRPLYQDTSNVNSQPLSAPSRK